MLDDVLQYTRSLYDLSARDKALNGLQIQNSGAVRQIVSCVDFSADLLHKTPQAQTLYAVHHGLFWGSVSPITERLYTLIRLMMERDSALIALHLPLDFHPLLGNNVLLAEEVGLHSVTLEGSYDQFKPMAVGFLKKQPFKDFVRQLESSSPLLSVLPHGKDFVKKVGLCTGSGFFLLEEAVRRGCDTFITGDAQHIYYHPSKESGINVISMGHYRSEKLGIKKYGERLSEHFSIPHRFVDIPTGL